MSAYPPNLIWVGGSIYTLYNIEIGNRLRLNYKI